ncbi:Hypothetical protein I5071_50650 [Sandaracinus amylolyticus]|nr:Hypothetical protein I5071_50650 [Sandaracinus amylolyticus]
MASALALAHRYDVHVATSAGETLEKLAATRYDVLWVDFASVASAPRERSWGLPVVMSGPPSIAEAAVRAGASCVLGVPYELASVVACLDFASTGSNVASLVQWAAAVAPPDVRIEVARTLLVQLAEDPTLLTLTLDEG